ncbi:MAG: hypothetical protein AAB321_01880 [Chloroflexota bacterium]
MQVQVLPQAHAVFQAVRLTFLALSLLGLAANLAGLAFTAMILSRLLLD